MVFLEHHRWGLESLVGSNILDDFETVLDMCHIYLYPRYTLLSEEATSGLSLNFEYNEDSSKTNPSMGFFAEQYKYLPMLGRYAM